MVSHREPKCRLEIVVVGAGIGGLAAAVSLGLQGHAVTVLEAAPKLLEVGAGIQVAANMLRVLDRWGVGSDVRAAATAIEEIHVLRWQNGATLSSTRIDRSSEEQLVVHRADLHTALLRRAQALKNVTIRTNSVVTDVFPAKPSVQLQDGQVITGDVVLGADGIKSKIRGKMLGDDADAATPTGDSCFRLLVDRESMFSDQDLCPYIEQRAVRRWIGPDRHVVAYPIKQGKLYNIAMAHPDRGGNDESWTRVGSKSEMLAEFNGWDPVLRKILGLVADEEVLSWKLCSHAPLTTWTKGYCALLGDACHPMLPYIAQGAAQAVEDAAALGIILSSLSLPAQIPHALKLYEKVRKQRAETIQSLGADNRHSLHMSDGPDQVARDLLFGTDLSPDRWLGKETRDYIMNWDAEESVRSVLTESMQGESLK